MATLFDCMQAVGASAHEMRPAYLDMQETAANVPLSFGKYRRAVT